MQRFRNSLKSVQNFMYRQLQSNPHQFRKEDKPVQYPARLTNYKDPIDDIKNYYKILGVERCSSYSEIKNAYYDLAKLYHPDNKGGKYKDQFNAIVEAYNVLIDDNKRNEYDKHGKIKDIQGYMKRIGEIETAKTIKEKLKLSDILRKDQSKKTPESPALTASETSINIDFMHSVLGLKKDFILKCLRKCPKCSGTYSNKSQPEKCKLCKGTRAEARSHSSTKVSVANRIPVSGICSNCDNKGYVYQNQSVYIVIPPGITSGEVIQVKNPQSETTNKCIAVKVNVSKSSKFERKGFHIHSYHTMTIPEAILGSRIKVPTIHGIVEVRIPPSSESHTTIVLYGKGIRTPKAIGDHIVNLKVEIPKTINEHVRKFLNLWNLEKKKTRPIT